MQHVHKVQIPAEDKRVGIVVGIIGTAIVAFMGVTVVGLTAFHGVFYQAVR